MTAHWGITDPAAVEGADEERERAFTRALRELDSRLKILRACDSTHWIALRCNDSLTTSVAHVGRPSWPSSPEGSTPMCVCTSRK
jgi:arsenate reductase